MAGVSALLAGCPGAGLAGGLGVAVCAAAAGLLFYRIARRKKPTHMTVNCWFCNQDTVVPYGNRNCWDCPNCEQYNGFQENGDYNKPIPAQYMEHLNHVVSSSSGPSFSDPSRPQQWVSSQVLLCRKCNNHQTTKIKQLASFSPRVEGKYDEEIEVYKHHLEQMYKLCRPCQAAVEYYIKHQNRQLRALLLSHQFKRRETDKTYMQSFCSSPVTTPAQVILLRFLAFLSCAFLLAMALLGSSDPLAPATPPPPTLPTGGNDSSAEASARGHTTTPEAGGWQRLLHLLPEPSVVKMREAWGFGQSHQVGVVALGLLTCLLAMLLAGRIRLRRIDAFASFLWFLVLGLHLVERYLQMDAPSWLDTFKLSATSLCCLVSLTAAVATRKATGQRRYRPRRYLSGDSTVLFPSGNGLGCPVPSPSLFVPAPPSFLQLSSQQFFRSPRRASSSSLPGRLNRALSLGTIPSLTRTDSGYLFSGSRPPSQASQTREAPGSDYFSLLSGSCAPSPLPSPAPSVAGSVASSSGSLRFRRPLISPARLNLKGQKLLLFPSPGEAPLTPSSSDEPAHPDGSMFTVELARSPTKGRPERGLLPDMRSFTEGGSICSDHSGKKEDNSSHSSACVVDTTTKGCPEEAGSWRGRLGNSLLRGLLAVSLAANALFTSAYLYQSLR
ncbi:transmembrane protein 201 [Ornithorhynchus anatinus]|uniref:transmembrane protein 201 n=1 Tax=Ornithorhynchus anatinus TaxID=9258 RepID=UPI0010A7FB0C|nr:transmembrane protein 201 [Ornithorhynchus anatinus]